MYEIDVNMIRPDTIIHVRSQDEWTALQAVLHELGAVHHEDTFDGCNPYRWIRSYEDGLEWTKGREQSTRFQDYRDFTKLEFEDLLLGATTDVDFSDMFDFAGGAYDAKQ